MSDDWDTKEHMIEDIKNAEEILRKDAILFSYPKWKYDILMEEIKKWEEEKDEKPIQKEPKN